MTLGGAWRRRIGVLAWALAAAGGGACAVGPAGRVAPPPADPDAWVAFDSLRILEEFQILASDSLEGRRTGTPGSALARELILAALQGAGVEAPPGGFLQPFEFHPRRDTTQLVHGANVVGVVPGREPGLGAIVLTAHYDHLGVREGEIFNGADDNASGTAALLSLARYLSAHPLRHTVVLVALDAEEMGLRGARAFLEAGWPGTLVLNVNLDMVSRSDSLLFVAGTYHYPHLRPILEGVRARPPVVLRFGHDRPGVEGKADWTRSSDHALFHAQGIPFVYFGVEDHEDYHRPTDTFERVNPAFFLASVRTILAALLALDGGVAALLALEEALAGGGAP